MPPRSSQGKPRYRQAKVHFEKRLFLRMLNFDVRPSESARRITVESKGVSPMTLDREEQEEAAAWEREVTSRFTERVGGVLDDSGQLMQVRSNVTPQDELRRGQGWGRSPSCLTRRTPWKGGEELERGTTYNLLSIYA